MNYWLILIFLKIDLHGSIYQLYPTFIFSHLQMVTVMLHSEYNRSTILMPQIWLNYRVNPWELP